jgi:hypothetical protein
MRRARCVLSTVIVVCVATPAHARGCHEESESGAVGYATCHEFGAWRVRTFRAFAEVTFGFSVHRLTLDRRSFYFCGGKTCGIAYGDASSIRGASTVMAYTGLARLGLIAIGPLRLGTHFELGGGDGPSLSRAPGVIGAGQGFSSFNFGLFGGARFAVGHTALGLDLVAAVQQLDGSFDSLKVRGVGRIDEVLDNRFVALADLSAVYFVQPFVAVGLWGGADVMHRDDVFGGVMIRFSSEAYEGLR